MAQIQTKWIADGAITGAKLASDVAIPSGATATTQSSGTNNTSVATTAFVQSAIGSLGDVLSLKGGLDASSLGAQLDDCQAGDYYRVTAAGTIFGTNSIELAVGDALICIADQTGTPDDGSDFFKVDNTELDDQTALQVDVTAAYDKSTASGNVIAGTDSVQSALEKIEKKEDDHIASTSNPHSVTKSQILSGNEIVNADVAADAAIVESKLSLDVGTSTLDGKIGNQTYTEQNYVTNSQSATASIDALDQQVKDNADAITAAAITEGPGIDVTANKVSIDLTANGGLKTTGAGDAATLDVDVDDSSIEIDVTNGIQVKASGITNDMLAGSIADGKLASDYIQTSEVDGSSIEFSGGSLNVKASGIGETELNNVDGGVDAESFVLATGYAAAAGTVAAADTIQAALAKLDGNQAEIDQNVNDLVTLSGVAENSTNLGTFTGSTIADSSTIKVALQALESAVESAVGSTNAEEVFTLDATDISNGYVELAQEALSASIIVTPVGGPMQLAGTDFTVSVPVAVTRITFAGDLASALAATDKLIVKYEY
jgi:hypothetical protein